MLWFSDEMLRWQEDTECELEEAGEKQKVEDSRQMDRDRMRGTTTANDAAHTQ